MRQRFCCAELKETSGVGRVNLIGIRHAESPKRSKRNEAEITRHKFSGTFDQFVRHRETEHVCLKGKDKLVISPIIEWTEQDVWDFIKVQGLEYCKLYDEGWKRIGCLFCPMATRKEILRQAERYPKYHARYMKLIHDLREIGWASKMKLPGCDITTWTDEDMWKWHISKERARVWHMKNIQQKKLEI